LSGETWIEGARGGFEAGSCMAQNPEKQRIAKYGGADQARKVLTNRQQAILLQRVEECGRIHCPVNKGRRQIATGM